MIKLLVDDHRHMAIEVDRYAVQRRGVKRPDIFVKLIRFGEAQLTISNEPAPQVDAEFVESPLPVARAAEMYLRSLFPKSEQAKTLLQAIVYIMKENSNMDLKNASMKDLLATYNSHVGADKQVTRFADRKTAERRVAALMNGEDAAPVVKETAKAAPVTETSNAPPSTATEKGKDNDMARSKNVRAKGAKKSARTERPKQGASGASIAKAVAATWKDPKVAKARNLKQHVRVAGIEYRSVKAAFEDLKLPLGKHIAFRAELKASGRKTFEGHTFTIVDSEA